ncbi:2-heptaprenyl-1 4-naphthoquinone methyltransferase like [Lecanosticta acicola]|uniref:2-heptaprenyl-1 4-naphthoquinone methyltransferase like n=1 Tax=Lecanosticta acicola TaxID=111012 RepID=A0AAI9EFR0_9PEZI|nr:2-heptaprenyl-1 4-naphthoquinone methyltransferase like [Lecanosticta acicola]
MAAAAPGGINAHAQSSFAKAAAYDQHRPAYSATIVQFLLEKLNVAGKHGAKIVDLAAGSGKFTEALAARPEEYQIIAVDPHDGMRGVLTAKNLPRVRIVDGSGDKMPDIQDSSVDAIIVAQGFHWFADMRALKEIHRILKRHSALGLTWNAEDYNSPHDHKASTAWEQKLQDLTFRIAKESGDHEPRFRNAEWRKVFDEQVKMTPISLLTASEDQVFSLPIGEHREVFEVALSRETLWERYRTLGHVAVLEGERREGVFKDFSEIVAEAETNEKGELVVHGNTYAFWTTKIPAEGRTAEEAIDDDERAEAS